MNDQPISLQKKYTEAVNERAELIKQRDELKFELDKAKSLLRQVKVFKPELIGGWQVLKEKICDFLDGE